MVLPSDEEAIIKKRLITRTQIPILNGQSPMYKLTKRFMALAQAANSSEGGAEACEEAYQHLMKELALFEQSFTRLEAVRNANQREQANYDTQATHLDHNIQDVKEDMVALKFALETARVERNHKGEYEVLRRLCMEHPGRAHTHTAIATLENEITELEHESTQLTAVLELRKKQFALLLHAADELQTELEEEVGTANGAVPDADPMDL